jgi:carbon storage regulator
MLVLTRRIGQVIMIGDDISVTLIEIKGGQVRLGILAPRSVAVHRKEIYDLLQRQAQDDTATPVNAIKQSVHEDH